MQKTTDTPSLEHIGESVKVLKHCSDQIIKVMEDQIDAIIAANSDTIESLSDKHASLSRRFRMHEKEFIDKLRLLLAEHEPSVPVRLTSLMEVFPESLKTIEGWHKLLSDRTRELQRKHDQILQLLEFAMSQNARMMQSMYKAHGEKNMHYAPTGKQTGMITGVAINQEI